MRLISAGSLVRAQSGPPKNYDRLYKATPKRGISKYCLIQLQIRTVATLLIFVWFFDIRTQKK